MRRNLADRTISLKAAISSSGRLLALLAFLAVLLLPVACSRDSAESTVDWIYDYHDALSRAQSENKPVMIDFWATWCTPCKTMDATTYADEEVGTFLNANFINLKVDVDKSNLAQVYNIRSIPQVVFLSPDGSEIAGRRIAGLNYPDPFLAKVQVVLDEWNQQT